jgi:DNA-directed RNA polymerase specialized sigma subunit
MIDRATEDRLWNAYWLDKSDANRNTILELYKGWIVEVARRWIVANYQEQHMEDLIAGVLVMALEAIAVFEPRRGIHFRQFMQVRIRAALGEARRNLDPMAVHARRKLTLIQRARAALRQELQRNPTEREIAQHLKISELSVTRCTAVESESYDHCWRERNTTLARYYAPLVVETEPTLPLCVEFFRLTKRLEPEKICALWLRYFAKMKVAQVAMELGLSERKTNRLLEGGLKFLRENLA